jgi:hydrogenase nickel incorporation protein HypA/HybF
VHEYSIVQALMERVEAEAAARQAVSVSRVFVRIGELSGVDHELLATAYRMWCERTVCEGAELEITRVPAEWSCRACGAPVERGARLQCAACGGRVALRHGDEILLERIEMEVA